MALTEAAGFWEARGAEERVEARVVATDLEAARAAESRAEHPVGWGEVLVVWEGQVATADSRVVMRLRCSRRIGSCSFVALRRSTSQQHVEMRRWSCETLPALC